MVINIKKNINSYILYSQLSKLCNITNLIVLILHADKKKIEINKKKKIPRLYKQT